MTETSTAPTTGTRAAPPVDPRLVRYAATSRIFFVLIGIIAVGQTAATVGFAWLLTAAVTGAIDGASAERQGTVLAGLAIVIVVRAGLLGARDAVASRAAARVESELRDRLLDAIVRLGPGWIAERSTARLGVLAGRGLEALEAYFGRYLPQLVSTAITTPLLILVMWWQDWISGLTVILTLPLIPVFMILIGLATRAVQDRQWQTLGRLATRFSDTVQGLSTLKVFGREHRAAGSIERVTDTYRRETLRVLRVSFLSGFALELLASIAVAIVAVSIGFRLLDGVLPLTVGLFVLLLAPEAYLPLRQVGVQFHAASEGVTAMQDVFAVLDDDRARSGAAAAATAGGEGRTDASAEASVAPRGPVSLTDLRVRRGDSTLEPVTLEASPGDVVLLEGPSGSGKSSVFAALRGAADFEGDALVGDVPIRGLEPAAWLAWAGQSAGLIAGTVADNVALGDPAPDARLVADALARAAASDIDPQLALAAQGEGLSGGQAQRVAVARAFYRFLRGRAGVLALDEPSAALDEQTEAALWRGIRGLADDGAAVLLISHRRTARAIADRVVTLHASVAGAAS